MLTGLFQLITMELVVQIHESWEACGTILSGDFSTKGNDTFTWKVLNVVMGE